MPGTASPVAFEPEPCAVRVHLAVDLQAARFRLLAWEDPDAIDSPRSPSGKKTSAVAADLCARSGRRSGRQTPGCVRAPGTAYVRLN